MMLNLLSLTFLPSSRKIGLLLLLMLPLATLTQQVFAIEDNSTASAKPNPLLSVDRALPLAIDLAYEIQDLLPADTLHRFEALTHGHPNDLAVQEAQFRMQCLYVCKQFASKLASGQKVLVRPTDLWDKVSPQPKISPAASDLDSISKICIDHVYKTYKAAFYQHAAEVIQHAKSLDIKRRLSVIEYLLIPELLDQSELEWNEQQANAVIQNLKINDQYSELEGWILDIGRPVAAWSFYKLASPENAKNKTLSQYISEQMDRLIVRKGKEAAVQPLRIALQNTASSEEQIAIGMRLANLLFEIKHYDNAAHIIGDLMSRMPQHPNFGEWTILRGIYLFNAKDYSSLLIMTTQLDVNRYASIKLQIMYLHWVALSELNRAQDAQKYGQEILNQFPDSLCCADVLFASAMQSLAAGQYTKADSILADLETRYPKWETIKQVNEMRTKLKGAK